MLHFLLFFVNHIIFNCSVVYAFSTTWFDFWLLYSCCFKSEPNAPPSNVTGHNASSTSIFVSWGQVPFLDQNGVIVSYTVTYRWLPSGPLQTKNVRAEGNQTTLSGLNEYTNYSITVFASTLKGGGLESTVIVVITDEDSKCVIFVFSCLVFHLARVCYVEIIVDFEAF